MARRLRQAGQSGRLAYQGDRRRATAWTTTTSTATLPPLPLKRRNRGLGKEGYPPRSAADVSSRACPARAALAHIPACCHAGGARRAVDGRLVFFGFSA